MTNNHTRLCFVLQKDCYFNWFCNFSFLSQNPGRVLKGHYCLCLGQERVIDCNFMKLMQLSFWLDFQMLSMRNGLSLHPMCLPGVLPPMLLPLHQTGLGYNEGPRFLNNNRGVSTFSGGEESLMHSAYNLSNTCITISNQPMVMPSASNVATPDVSLGFEQSIQPHFRPVSLPTSSKVSTSAWTYN